MKVFERKNRNLLWHIICKTLNEMANLYIVHKNNMYLCQQ